MQTVSAAYLDAVKSGYELVPRVTLLDGSVVTARADDGFLSVQNDKVTIVGGTASLVS